MSNLWTNEEVAAFMESLRGIVTIGKRAEDGDARSFELFARDLPIVSLAAIYNYGFQRFFNDKCGGSDKKLADKFAIVETLMLNLRQGKVRKTRTVEEPANPIEAEALREARVAIHALAKKGGADWYRAVAAKLELPFDGSEADMKEIRDEAIAFRAAKPENVEAATKIVEARKAIRVTTADLGI
jgi:hypothetical protein